MKSYLQILTVGFLYLTGCKSPSLLITQNYLVLNEKNNNCEFSIKKIFPKDTLYPSIEYMQDSFFRYTAILDSAQKCRKKVLFNEEQSNLGWIKIPINDTAWVSTYNTKKYFKIGELEINSWYLIENLDTYGNKFIVHFKNKNEPIILKFHKSNY